MRAAIFASLVPAPASDKEREELEKLIATIVDWDRDNVPDLLIGAEDGFLYYLKNPRSSGAGS